MRPSKKRSASRGDYVLPGGRHREKACLLGGSGNIVLVMNAIETTGVVDAQHQLRLDKPLPIAGHSRVRVIVLVPDEADISEAAWTETVATSPAFDFLKDTAEDIYTATDGKPLSEQHWLRNELESVAGAPLTA